MANKAQHGDAAKKSLPGDGFRSIDIRRVQDHGPHAMSSLIPNMRWNANSWSQGPGVEYLKMQLGAWFRHPVELALDSYVTVEQP
jgi:hypothetical protein